MKRSKREEEKKQQTPTNPYCQQKYLPERSEIKGREVKRTVGKVQKGNIHSAVKKINKSNRWIGNARGMLFV